MAAVGVEIGFQQATCLIVAAANLFFGELGIEDFNGLMDGGVVLQIEVVDDGFIEGKGNFILTKVDGAKEPEVFLVAGSNAEDKRFVREGLAKDSVCNFFAF